MNSPTFILGTGRCGSTLVYESLCLHPDIGFISNLDDRLPRKAGITRSLNNVLYAKSPQSLGLRTRFSPSEGYRLLDRQVSPILSQTARELHAEDVTPRTAQRFQDFVRQRSSRQGKRLFVLKFTGWPRVQFIREIFPDARFLHIVRDGRAVANSFLQMPWWGGYEGPASWRYGPLPPDLAPDSSESQFSFVTLAGVAWRQLVREYLEAPRNIPSSNWLEMRYEDIIASPASAFEEILGYLDLEVDHTFARRLRKVTFDQRPGDAYRRDLSPDQVAALTRTLLPELQAYGYEPSA